MTFKGIPIIFQPDLGYDTQELYMVRIISLRELVYEVLSGKYKLVTIENRKA